MILALEAASTDVSIAVADLDGSMTAQDGWTARRGQSADLMPRVESMLGDAGLGVRDLTAVGVGLGPGSFTGLRVALALAKGLCAARGLAICGVPSLAAWLDAHPDAALAVGRAGANEAYLLSRGEREPRIVDRDELFAIVGDARVVVPTELAEAFGLAGAEPPRAAGAVARAAATRLRRDPQGDDVRTLEPMYLRAPRGVPTATQGEVRWL